MFADMAELADALDLGSSVNRRAGSTPVIRTRKNKSREHCSRLLFLTEANRVLEPGFRSRLPPRSVLDRCHRHLAPCYPLSSL